MEKVYNKPLFKNHVRLLLGLILPKPSWTKKIDLGNKYYGVMKQKFSFFYLMIFRRFDTRKAFLPKKHRTNIKI